jgi:hypothetical protein
MSRIDDVLEAVEGLFANGVGVVRTYCPWCSSSSGKKNLAYFPESGYFSCWKCEEKGFVNSDSRPHIEVRLTAIPSSLPSNFKPINDEHHARRYRDYLYRRNVPHEVIEDAQLHYGDSGGDFEGCIIFPDWHGGLLRGWVARPLWMSRYWNNEGLQRESLVLFQDRLDDDEPVVVVEGPLDALPHWPHCVALLGKPSERQLQLLAATTKPVFFALDGDARGEGWAATQRLRLAGHEASYFVNLPSGKDPGDIDHDSFMDMINEAYTEL